MDKRLDKSPDQPHLDTTLRDRFRDSGIQDSGIQDSGIQDSGIQDSGIQDSGASKGADEGVSQAVWSRYIRTRKDTLALVATLLPEDFALQGMADASPPKWHLAHTSWFFDTFVLAAFQKNYQPHHNRFHYLFNSYYVGEGEIFARPKRGLLSRPTLAEVLAYRSWVDEQVGELLNHGHRAVGKEHPSLLSTVLLGIHHECQHQELILTDIKYSLFQNPLFPCLLPDGSTHQPPQQQRQIPQPSHSWRKFASGQYSVGTDLPPLTLSTTADLQLFAFDNECPRHDVLRSDIALGTRLVTNGEFQEFIADDGYHRPELWLSEGYHWRCQNNITAPLYWLTSLEVDKGLCRGIGEYDNGHSERQGAQQDAQWYRYGLAGLRPLDTDSPVAHISYYEADAYARWRKARLPTEQEWETCVGDQPIEGNLLNPSSITEPQAACTPTPSTDRKSADGPALLQAYGDVWEWTQSSYSPYPGFKTAEGSIGEYNGKFMVNQYVLKGGSSFTPEHHIRPSYRNFFPSESRWQNTGLRLAKDTS